MADSNLSAAMLQALVEAGKWFGILGGLTLLGILVARIFIGQDRAVTRLEVLQGEFVSLLKQVTTLAAELRSLTAAATKDLAALEKATAAEHTDIKRQLSEHGGRLDELEEKRAFDSGVRQASKEAS